ncbi:MAG: universal stress protein [Planctomycetota bacterium]
MSEPYSIFLPSDFSPASEKAFAHALAIAIIRKAKLTILHAGMADWGTGALSVREVLARWGYLEEGADRDAVFNELKVRIHKIEARKTDPLQASLDYLERDPADLLVISTEQRRGLPRYMHRSVAEQLARKTRGFIDPADGRSSLRQILVAQPNPQALEAAADARRLSTAPQLRVRCLTVGEEPPRMGLPERAGVTWETEHRTTEDEVALIAEQAEGCDLLVIPATERRGIRRSTLSEQVVRAAPCPVLVVQ